MEDRNGDEIDDFALLNIGNDIYRFEFDEDQNRFQNKGIWKAESDCSNCTVGIGSIAGNPFDVLKTRMMASEGAEALGLGHFASDIMKNQGFGGFYKGIEANVARAMILNATKMACYDTCKGFVFMLLLGLE